MDENINSVGEMPPFTGEISGNMVEMNGNFNIDMSGNNGEMPAGNMNSASESSMSGSLNLSQEMPTGSMIDDSAKLQVGSLNTGSEMPLGEMAEQNSSLLTSGNLEAGSMPSGGMENNNSPLITPANTSKILEIPGNWKLQFVSAD